MAAVAIATEGILVESGVACTGVIDGEESVRFADCALVESVAVNALSTGVVARDAGSQVIPVAVVAVAEAVGQGGEGLASEASVLLGAVAGQTGVEA